MKTKEEIEILRADALAGDPDAQFALGFAYFSGDGVNKDDKEAFNWFKSSAEQGNKNAQFDVGFCYELGRGAVKNIGKAIEWYKKSAEQGHEAAALKLGQIYEKGYTVNHFSFEKDESPQIKADLEESFYWYYIGAKDTSVGKINMLHLANCYEQGIGTPKRLYRAYELYSKCHTDEANKRLEALSKNYNPLFDSRLSHIDIIGNNPYRILGVYCNVTERELRANKSKLEVMAKVGQTPTCETDHLIPCNISDNIEDCKERIKYAENLVASKKSEWSISHGKQLLEQAKKNLSGWLSIKESKQEWQLLPNRTIVNITNATQKIASDIERIRYGLFWFWNYTDDDKKALKLLSEHKWDEAKEIWDTGSGFSAHINRAVLNWIARIDTWAIIDILTLIHSDEKRSDFISAVTSGRIEISKEELSKLFWDTLFDFPEEEMSLYDFNEITTKPHNSPLGLFFDLHKSEKELLEKLMFDSIKAPLDNLLRVAEAQNPNDWDKLSDAYYKANNSSFKVLTNIERFVGKDYYRYNLLRNEIAEKFLQFAIHFNNDNKENWNAPSTALYFAKRAYSLADDETLLERCKKNIDIFKNNTNITQTEKALEVIDEKIKKIDGIRVTFPEIETTLKSITAYLDVIRDHAGKDSAIYLNESSRVVNIFLNRVIDICNYSKSFFTDSGAAPILKQLQKMDMTSETKQRLERNIKTLSSHLSAVLGEGAWERVSANQEKKGNKCISNDDIQIKAPNSVRAGDTFLVSITIKGKYERIDSPQTTNLTLVDGPTTSFSETKSFGLQTKLKEEIGYSTTFSYHYRAIEKGIAQINVKNCTDNGKRSIGRCITIQVQEQIPKKTTETKSSKRKRRKLLYISLVCLLLTIITVLSVLLFRQDGLMLTKSTISLLSIGGIFIISTFLFSYSLWNLEDGHYKHLGIVENLKGVGISAFSSLFIALIVGWAISALTCWLSPSVIVVGADNSHEKYQLLGKSQGRFLSNNSLYIQNNTNETIFLVGVYYSSRFSNSWNNNDIIVEIPSNGLTKIDKEPNCYFEVPPQTITYRTRNYSASSSGKYQWFLLDMQLLNQYQTYGK